MSDIDPQKGLSLDEMRLQREGDALIELTKAGNKTSPVLGPDGKPLEGVALVEGTPPPEIAAQAREEMKKGMNEQLSKLRKSSREEQDKALKIAEQVLDENPVVQRISQALIVLHRALVWAKLELQMNDDRVTDTVLTHMERQIQTAVMHGSGFYVDKLPEQLHMSVIKLIERQAEGYQKLIKIRRAKLKKVISCYAFNGKTLTLPAQAMYDLFPQKKVTLGSILIVTGTQEAVTAALNVCMRAHIKNDHSQAHFFRKGSAPLEMKDSRIVNVAEAWWQDALQTIGRMYKVFNVVVNSPSSVLAIEDFNPLMTAAPETMAESERVSRILSGIQQWAVENAVYVLIGAPSDDPNLKYGGLPQCRAELRPYISATFNNPEGLLTLRSTDGVSIFEQEEKT